MDVVAVAIKCLYFGTKSAINSKKNCFKNFAVIKLCKVDVDHRTKTNQFVAVLSRVKSKNGPYKARHSEYL